MDKLKQIYEDLKSDNYDVPDFDTFKSTLSKESNRKIFYEDLKSGNYDVPDYDRFNTTLFGTSDDKPDAQPIVKSGKATTSILDAEELGHIGSSGQVPIVPTATPPSTRDSVSDTAPQNGYGVGTTGIPYVSPLAPPLIATPEKEAPQVSLNKFKPQQLKPNSEWHVESAIKDTFSEERKKAEAELSAVENAKNAGSAFVPHFAQGINAAIDIEKYTDPQKVINATIKRVLPKIKDDINREVQNGANAEDITNRYASYIQDMLVNEYVNERIPKESAEYIAGSAMRDNILSNLMSGVARIGAGSSGINSDIDTAAYGAYNPNMSDKISAGVSTLLADAPIFALTGGIGGLASKGLIKAGGNMLTKGVAKSGLSTLGKRTLVNAGERMFSSGVGGRLTAGAVSGAVNLGSYDVIGESSRQLESGYYDLGAIGKRGLHGVALGGATAPIGILGKYITRGESALIKAGTDVSAFGLESGVFAMPSLMEMKKAGKNITLGNVGEEFAISAATLGMMKVAHLPKLRKEIKDRYASDGVGNMQLNKSELDFLDKNGYNFGDLFKTEKLDKTERLRAVDGGVVELASSEKNNHSGSSEGIMKLNDTVVKDAELSNSEKMLAETEVFENYERAINDNNIPIATRRKLMYGIEGKLYSGVPVVYGVKIEDMPDSKGSVVTPLNERGIPIERIEYSSKEKAKRKVAELEDIGEKNSIEALENVVDGYAEKQAVYKACAESPNGEWLYKEYDRISKTPEKERTVEDQNLYAGVVEKAEKLYDKENSSSGVREQAQEFGGVDIEKAILKPRSKRTKHEQDVINDYADVLRSKVIKPQTNEERGVSVVGKMRNGSEVSIVSGEIKRIEGGAVENKEDRVYYEKDGKVEVAQAGDFVSEVETPIATVEDMISLNGVEGAGAEYIREHRKENAEPVAKLQKELEAVMSYTGEGAEPANYDYWAGRLGVEKITPLPPDQVDVRDENKMGNDLTVTENDVPLGLTNNLEDGISERISQGKHGTLPKENGRVEELANRLRGGSGTPQGDTAEVEDSGRNLSRQEKKDEDARIAVGYAKESGVWYPNIYDLGVPFSSGNENTVVVNKDEGVVYKINNLMNSQTVSDLLDRVQIHNEVFPNTRYEFVGISGADFGKRAHAEPVFKQRLIKDAVEASYDDISGYMDKLGFKQVSDFVYRNGVYEISDMRPRNVLKDKDGDIYVIDAGCRRLSERERYEGMDEEARNRHLLDIADSSKGNGMERSKRLAEVDEVKGYASYKSVKKGLNKKLDELEQIDESDYDKYLRVQANDIPNVKREIASVDDAMRELEAKHGAENLVPEMTSYKGEKIRTLKELSTVIDKREPQTLREYILREMIGTKLRWSDARNGDGVVTSRGFGKETGWGAGEKRVFQWVLSDDGMTPDQFAHAIMESDVSHLLNGKDISDVKNEILSVVGELGERTVTAKRIAEKLVNEWDVQDKAYDEAMRQEYLNTRHGEWRQELLNRGVDIDKVADVDGEFKKWLVEREAMEELVPVVDERVEKLLDMERAERELDGNGIPFVKSRNGSTSFGEITAETGLKEAPIKLSEGFHGENGKGYGLAHIRKQHEDQILKAGFNSVEDFVWYVASNYDKRNVKVGKSRGINSQTYLIEIEDNHSNTLFIELSQDGDYWNVNSGGVFRKGYSRNKETVTAKTEPKQDDTTQSSESSLLENEKGGSLSKPNSETQQLSASKDSEVVGEKQVEGVKSDGIVDNIASEREKVNTNPTEAQKEAGNYKKGHVRIDGMDITIENPKGSERSGIDNNGKAWSITMNNDYGYILGTKGVDGDHIDMFISDNPESGDIYVVDQINTDGSFDEHKVMYGFTDASQAKHAYLSNYENGWKGLGVITKVSKEGFKKWIESSHRKTKPFAEYKIAKEKSDGLEANAEELDYLSYEHIEAKRVAGEVHEERLADIADMEVSDAEREVAYADEVARYESELTEERKRYDDAVKEQLSVLGDEKDDGIRYRDGEKKSATSDRTGAVAGTSSSDSLNPSDKAHLIRHPFAHKDSATKVGNDVDVSKRKLQKLKNKGYNSEDISSSNAIVRNLGFGIGLAKSASSNSYYGEYDVDGRRVKLRLSTHPANGARMGGSEFDERVSVVVYKNGEHKGDNVADYVEYTYHVEKSTPEDVVKSIIDGVDSLLSGNGFVDSGVAEKVEYRGKDAEVANEVTELSHEYGVESDVVSDVSGMPDNSAKRAVEKGRNIKGWYDSKSGKIVIYLPNTVDVQDVRDTFFHEAIGHKGIKEFMGEKKHNELLDGVYELAVGDGAMPSPIGVSKAERRRIADEYIADTAEAVFGNKADDNILNRWDRIVGAVRDFLRKLFKVKFSAKDVEYLLWRASRGMRGTDKGVVFEAENISRKSEALKMREAERVDDIVSRLKENAEPMPELELTPDNWKREFGTEGKVSTPIGEVKMGENQYEKLDNDARRITLGMVKPTLERPDVIIEEKSGNELAERNSSYVFVKTFLKPDGSKHYFFTSVTVRQEGMDVSISNHIVRPNRLKEIIRDGRLIHLKDAALPPETTLSVQGNQPTQPSGASLFENKVSEDVLDLQEKGEKDDGILFREGKGINKREQKLRDDVTEMKERLRDNKESVALTVKVLNEFIKENLSVELSREAGKGEITSILSALRDAVTHKSVGEAMRRIEHVVNGVETRMGLKELDKLMKIKVDGLTPKGVVKAQYVDSYARTIIENVRNVFRNGLRDSIERDIWEKEKQIATLEASGGDVNTTNVLRDEIIELEVRKEYYSIVGNSYGAKEIEERKAKVETTIADKYYKNIPVSIEEKAELASMPLLERLGEVKDALNNVANLKEDIKRLITERKKLKPLSSDEAEERESKRKRRIEINCEIGVLDYDCLAYEEDVNSTISFINKEMRDIIDTGHSALLDWSSDKIAYNEDMLKEVWNAVSDKPVKGMFENEESSKPTKKAKKNMYDNFVHGMFFSPLVNFNFLTKYIEKGTSYTGEGVVYNRLMKHPERGYIACEGRRVSGIREITEDVKGALKLYVGKHDNTKEQSITFTTRDRDGEILDSWDQNLNIEQACAVWAWSRMESGKLKLENQGIDEASLNQIKGFIGDGYVKFFNWLQDGYLPKLRRDRYNPVHERVYGRSLGEIPHYFPFRIYKESIPTNDHLGEIRRSSVPGIVSGNIIKRTDNKLPLDLTIGFSDILENYIKDNELWVNFAELTQDVQTIVNNKHFKALLEANKQGLHEDFKEAALIALHLYRDDVGGKPVNDFIVKWNKGVAGGKIAWRLGTAFKQILSAPAFMTYSLNPKFQAELDYVFLNPINWSKHLKWAYNNMPLFRDRWDNGSLGNPIFEDKSFKWLDNYLKIGMIPNKIIDSFTCGLGAKAIYNHKFRELKEIYTEDIAHKMAIIEGEIAFNESQQSAVSAFLNPMQSSGAALNKGLTTFLSQNIANYSMMRAGQIDRGRATKYILKDRKDGYAYKKWAESNFKAGFYGWISQLLWAVAGGGILGSIYGSLKEEDYENLIKQVAFAPIQGTVLGNAASTALNYDKWEPLILIADINEVVKSINRIDESAPAYAYTQMVIACLNLTGINAVAFQNMVSAIERTPEYGIDPITFSLFVNSARGGRGSYARDYYLDHTNNIKDYVNACANAESLCEYGETGIFKATLSDKRRNEYVELWFNNKFPEYAKLEEEEKKRKEIVDAEVLADEKNLHNAVTHDRLLNRIKKIAERNNIRSAKYDRLNNRLRKVKLACKIGDWKAAEDAMK